MVTIILAPYQFKNVVSEKTIEKSKGLPIELTKDFIMLNPTRVNTFKEIELITNANVSEVTKVNYMLSHIVREYWSHDLKDIACAISNEQAIISAIYSVSSTLKMEGNKLPTLNRS
ncbi:MAG: hypothetical protein PV340_02645 [Wolbachia sp.]|nr:hypothetical protein [Wolbachia sp.]MDD9336783.1 hypothetical protein [Wolbachia sp.]